MPSYCKLIVVGHLVRDPMTKNLPSNTVVCECAIAFNRRYKTAGGEQREESCFIDFECFGRSGEVLAQYAKKGDPILLDGRLRQEVWEDKNGGGKRSKLSMIAESFQFLRGRDAAGDETDQRPAQRPLGQRPAPKSGKEEMPVDHDAIDPADIPF